MSSFDLLLATTWMIVGLMALGVTLVYIWSRRFPRWQAASWWHLVLFSMGVTGVVVNLVSVLLMGFPETAEDGRALVMGLIRSGVFLALGWLLNNRRRSRLQG